MKHGHIFVSAIVLLLFIAPIRPIDAQIVDMDAPAAGEIVNDIYINGRFGFSIDFSGIGWDTRHWSDDRAAVISIVQRTDPMFDTRVFVTPKDAAPVETEMEILRFVVSEFAPPDPDTDFSRMVQTVVHGVPEREYYRVSGAVENAGPFGLFAVYLSSIEDYWFIVITFVSGPEPGRPDPVPSWSDEFWSRFRFHEG